MNPRTESGSNSPRGWRRALVVAALSVVGIVTWSFFVHGRRSDVAQSSATVQPAVTAGPMRRMDGEAAANASVSGNHSNLGLSDARAARISFAGRYLDLSPNVHGEYARVAVLAREKIDIVLSFPNAEPGEHIAVQAEDGGALLGDTAAGVATVGDDHRVHMQFQTSAWDGMHRVTVRRGGDRRVFEFWVGPEQPVVVRVSPMGSGPPSADRAVGPSG